LIEAKSTSSSSLECFWMQPSLQSNVLGIDARVHVALAHPNEDVLALRHAPHVRAEEHVREKENLLLGGN